MNAVRIDWPEGCAVREGATLGPFTTFGLGGACRAVVECPDAESLAEAARRTRDARVPFFAIGQGSNLLVADEGVDAVVLRYCAEASSAFDAERVPGNRLLDDVVREATERGLGDLSPFSGIPGTLAGATVGNAGAFGQAIGDFVESVRVVDRAGVQREIGRDALGFAYRTSALKGSDEVLLDVRLRLEPADRDAMRAERERILAMRREKHPDWRRLPCAGSVFRNLEPASPGARRTAAGRLLEEVGAKGFREGGAYVFERHANIVIAGPGATALDVFRLTERMAAAVEARFGIRPEREIRLIGRF